MGIYFVLVIILFPLIKMADNISIFSKWIFLSFQISMNFFEITLNLRKRILYSNCNSKFKHQVKFNIYAKIIFYLNCSICSFVKTNFGWWFVIPSVWAFKWCSSCGKLLTLEQHVTINKTKQINLFIWFNSLKLFFIFLFL